MPSHLPKECREGGHDPLEWVCCVRSRKLFSTLLHNLEAHDGSYRTVPLTITFPPDDRSTQGRFSIETKDKHTQVVGRALGIVCKEKRIRKNTTDVFAS